MLENCDIPADLMDLLSGRLLAEFEVHVVKTSGKWQLTLKDLETSVLMSSTAETFVDSWRQLKEQTGPV